MEGSFSSMGERGIEKYCVEEGGGGELGKKRKGAVTRCRRISIAKAENQAISERRTKRGKENQITGGGLCPVQQSMGMG